MPRPYKIGVFMLTQAGRGGAEKHTAELATHLHRRNHDVRLICNEPVLAAMGQMTTIESPTFPLEQFRPADVNSYRDWRRVLLKAGFDAVVLEKGHINQGTRAFHRAARNCAKFYLLIEQSRAFPPAKLGGTYFGLIPRLGLWRRKIIRRHRQNARYPDRILCVSEENRKAFVKDFGYPQSKCVVVHNCVDVERFHPLADAPAQLRRELDLPVDSRVVVMMGRFAHQKNHMLALQAFNRLLKSPACPPQTYLLLVGDGTDEGRLREEACTLKLNGQVIFYGRTETPETIMGGADYLLMTSRHEGLPLTVAEAFACGCPAVATDAGGTREILSSADLGWLVESNASQDVAQALLAALSQSPGQRRDMGNRCRKHAVENFNAKVLYGRFCDMVEEGVKSAD